MVCLEIFMDFQAYGVMAKAWVKGLWKRGFAGAHEAAAGLA
jgi:aarF domain-containing kinase